MEIKYPNMSTYYSVYKEYFKDYPEYPNYEDGLTKDVFDACTAKIMYEPSGITKNNFARVMLHLLFNNTKSKLGAEDLFDECIRAGLENEFHLALEELVERRMVKVTEDNKFCLINPFAMGTWLRGDYEQFNQGLDSLIDEELEEDLDE